MNGSVVILAIMAISVLEELKANLRNENVSLEQLLNIFCHEEFMRRLSVSNFRDNLILKGDLLLYYISGFTTSPIVNAEYLLKNYSNDLVSIKKLVNEIILHPFNDAPVVFEIKSLEVIDEIRVYNVVRANLIGIIEGTSTYFNLDFKVGDIIVPSPEERTLPVLINEFESPVILTYSLESTVSEKLDMVISSTESTSQMKDIYDMYYLANTFDFEGRKLQEAIYETLTNRGTTYEKNSITAILRLDKDSEIKRCWEVYCKDTLKYELDFTDVLNKIIEFTLPPYMSMITEGEFFKNWCCKNGKYI